MCQYTEGLSREARQKACPKISPDAGIELNERNRQALEHYQECRAVGTFPDDAIVKRNAKIIREEYDAHEAMQLQKTILNAMAAGRA